jgi:3-methylcrotonyl-CoA carboxylase alpha subunit
LLINGKIDASDRLIAEVDGAPVSLGLAFQDNNVTLFGANGPVVARWIDPLEAAGETEAAGGRLTSPMPGKIISVHVSEGETVKRGAPLVVLEAMKMEHTISAPGDGIVEKVHFQAGDLVEEGVDLLVFEPDGEA